MRLWHKELIAYLPQKQLVSQWRECCGIARNINVLGYPNHILVNKIMDYPIEHFIAYSRLVADEMIARGYKVHWNRFMKWFPDELVYDLNREDIFKDWHNRRYLKQCYHNLEEKNDCNGIPIKDWQEVYRRWGWIDES